MVFQDTDFGMVLMGESSSRGIADGPSLIGKFTHSVFTLTTEEEEFPEEVKTRLMGGMQRRQR